MVCVTAHVNSFPGPSRLLTRHSSNCNCWLYKSISQIFICLHERTNWLIETSMKWYNFGLFKELHGSVVNYWLRQNWNVPTFQVSLLLKFSVTHVLNLFVTYFPQQNIFKYKKNKISQPYLEKPFWITSRLRFSLFRCFEVSARGTCACYSVLSRDPQCSFYILTGKYGGSP